MLYPLDKHCETNPRVTMKDITLKNITSVNGVLPPGIIRCNASNPCDNFVFEDVQVRSKFWEYFGEGKYITENVNINYKGNNFPAPSIEEHKEPVMKEFYHYLFEGYARVLRRLASDLHLFD